MDVVICNFWVLNWTIIAEKDNIIPLQVPNFAAFRVAIAETLSKVRLFKRKYHVECLIEVRSIRTLAGFDG